MLPDHGFQRRRARARANMRPLILGQAVSLFGDYIAYVTLPLFIVRLTGSALDLGLTAASETLPLLLFGLAAGVILDRSELRRSLIFSDLARAAAFALLALAAALDVATTLMVFAVAFVVGSMSSLFDSGLQAFMPLTLTEELLVTANSRLQLVRTLAWTAGAAAGGVLIQFLGAAVAFGVNAGTFVFSALMVSVVRVIAPRPPRTPSRFRTELAEGLRFLWEEPRLRWATIGAAAANMVFAPLEITLALFGREQLGLSEAGVGWLYALQALIGAGGAVIAPTVARRLRLGRTFVVGLVLMAGGFLAVSQSSTFIAVVPTGVALVGVSWINISVSTLRQRLTPAALMGRVIAASRTMSWAGIPVGAAVGGLIGEAVGLVDLYVGTSLLVLGLAAVLAVTPLWHRPVAVAEEAA